MNESPTATLETNSLPHWMKTISAILKEAEPTYYSVREPDVTDNEIAVFHHLPETGPQDPSLVTTLTIWRNHVVGPDSFGFDIRGPQIPDGRIYYRRAKLHLNPIQQYLLIQDESEAPFSPHNQTSRP